jgi:hypothetical protein
MREVIKFIPRGDISALQRVEDFIALARDQLTVLVTRNEWNQDSWDVSSSFVRKGKSKVASRLHFLRHGTTQGRGDDITGEPLRPPFAEFARAFIAYNHATAPAVFDRLIARLNALRFLEAIPPSTAAAARIPKPRSAASLEPGWTTAPKSPLPQACATSRISTACSSVAMAWPRGRFAARPPQANWSGSLHAKESGAAVQDVLPRLG